MKVSSFLLFIFDEMVEFLSTPKKDKKKTHNFYHGRFSFRRTLSTSGASSYSGAGQPVDEFDRAMQNISHDIDNMNMSVHLDSPTSPDSFLPKST